MLAFFFTLALGFASPSWAQSIPPSPPNWVLDEPNVVDPHSKSELARLATEHERLTGDQIVFAVFKSLENEELVDFSNRVYKAWKIGENKKNNGVLIALFWKEHKIRIEVGYGLEPLLTDARSKQIISNVLAPELKAGKTGQGLLLTLVEILKVIDSPLVKDGTSLANIPAHKSHKRRHPLVNSNNLFLLIFVIFILIRILSDGTLLSRRGAHRYRSGGFWGGGFGGGGFGSGGFGGGSSGGGGFSGGGGMSGGGGASGDW